MVPQLPHPSALLSPVLCFVFLGFLNIFVKEIVSWLKKRLKPTGLVFAYSRCKSRDSHFTPWALRGQACMAFPSQ